MSKQNDDLDALAYSLTFLARALSGQPFDSCDGCCHNLGGGHCRINVEEECREGGGFELWEFKKPEEINKQPKEKPKRPKLSESEKFLKWAAIILTLIAYPLVLYRLYH